MRMFQISCRGSASPFDVILKRLSWRLIRVSSASLSTGRNVESKNNLTGGGPGTKATEEQLVSLKDTMAEYIPKLFCVTHNFKDYHSHVIFEDNIRNVRTTGILNYYRQVLLCRSFCLLRYAKCKIEVIKITHDTQDSKICTRWTFKGILTWKYMKYFIHYLKGREIPPCRVIDGFSIMYVGDDGRVWKHVLEKMIPDDDPVRMTGAAKSIISSKIENASLAVNPKL